MVHRWNLIHTGANLLPILHSGAHSSFSLFTHHASDLAISGIAFLASKTCLGKKLFLTTMALFAIDISIPDVSAFRYLQSWGYRKPPYLQEPKDCQAYTDLHLSLGTLFFQFFYTSILIFTDTHLQTYHTRILSHLYPPNPKEPGLVNLFICSSIHIQTITS